ncbi:MAG: RNA polymerase sigma factor [Verrucomicrobiota bacterium]
MNPSAEAELIARCRQRDTQAWDELFDLHYASTCRFLFQLSADFSREDVEEICQEVFLAVIRNLDSFQGGARVQTWIFRIALNKARDTRERQRAAKRGGGRVPLSLHSPGAEEGLAIDPPSPAAGPDLQLLQLEQVDLVRAALDRLSDPCREIIELRYFGDLSYEEIGRALKLNEKTVSSRLSKCLDRLEMIMRPMFTAGTAKWEKPATFSV